MKAHVCLIAGSLLMMGLAAEAKGPTRGVKEVVLTASQVASARDIEEAIDQATDYGTHPGIVTLDAREGDFFYTEPDRSINIYCAGVTLRSLTARAS